MSQPNLNLGGPTPPLGSGPSLDDDEKAMRKGNVWVLVAAGIGALGVVVGLLFLLASEQPDQYGTIGRQVNGMKTEHFDGFWVCTFGGDANAARAVQGIRNNDQLRTEITKRASRSPANYAQAVRQRCMPKLDEHQAPLHALIAPEDLQADLAALGQSLEALKAGWTGYLRTLEAMQEGYDEASAGPELSNIAKGWFDYRNAHRQINAKIAEHLEE